MRQRSIAALLGTSQTGFDTALEDQPEVALALAQGRAAIEQELVGTLVQRARDGDKTCLRLANVGRLQSRSKRLANAKKAHQVLATPRPGGLGDGDLEVLVSCMGGMQAEIDLYPEVDPEYDEQMVHALLAKNPVYADQLKDHLAQSTLDAETASILEPNLEAGE